MRWAAVALALLLPITVSAGTLGEEWAKAEIRFGVNAAEIVWPVLGETGKVQPRFHLIAGVGWRPISNDPLDDDGLKPVGIWVGGSIDVDNDPFNYVEGGLGMSYQEAVHIGMMLWVGNKTVTANDVMETVPGLDVKLKTVIGLGLDAEP